jgi:hypothetical protein
LIVRRGNQSRWQWATLSDIPPDVREWIRSVSKKCNSTATSTLADCPNIQEDYLDNSIVQALYAQSQRVRLNSGWTVEIETHFVGGLAHHWRWEIADLAIFLCLRGAGLIHAQKLALLQSKRLYPRNAVVRELVLEDFELGMGRLLDPEDAKRRLAKRTDYEFDADCRYQALLVRDEQYKRIKDYEAKNLLNVYYSFYNPPYFPYTKTLPSAATERFSGEISIGVRILGAASLRQEFDIRADSYRPTPADLLLINLSYGWALEDFVADHLLNCTEGNLFQSRSEERIQNLLSRRTGAIMAATVIRIEPPSD